MLRMELADIEETLMKMRIDLDYIEDSKAEVDANFIFGSNGNII